MTRTARHFPATLRAATVAALLVVVSVVGTIAGAAPSKRDVERAEEKIQRLEGQLTAIREELAATQLRLNAAADRVERHEIALQEVQVDLARTRGELGRARDRYDRIVARLNERAVEAYMQGPASSIDFLLGAETVADLTDRLAYVDALARSDADLSVRVANLKNRLTVIESQLESDQARRARRLGAAREQRDALLGLFEDVQSLVDRQERILSSAQRFYRRQKAAYAEWVQEQRAAQGQAMGGRVWNGGDLPEPYDHVFAACPTAHPRAFSDGFGAPRYGGGYHLHKGVDIVAPMGTPILAAFDGYSYTSSNSLGGNVVFVVGAEGKVYNAHVSRYSDLSNGRVSAGDVIGYVGSTGYSSVPHNHFEFHPNVMPGPWPVSYYGYSVIEDAINPYPLLIQACG